MMLSSIPNLITYYMTSIIYELKIIVRSFGSSKNTKLEDGPYCTISGNEPLFLHTKIADIQVSKIPQGTMVNSL